MPSLPAPSVSRARRRPFTAEEEPPRPTGRFWVPGTAAGAGTMVLLPDARDALWLRGLRWVVLVACFLAGGALATVAFPWVETALESALDEVRSVTEAGFAHPPGGTAAGTPPEGSARP